MLSRFFSVGGEDTNFKLHVGGPCRIDTQPQFGDEDGDWQYHTDNARSGRLYTSRGLDFSTYDNVNCRDDCLSNVAIRTSGGGTRYESKTCAIVEKDGWWHKNCRDEYGNINREPFSAIQSNIEYTRLLIRRHDDANLMNINRVMGHC